MQAFRFALVGCLLLTVAAVGVAKESKEKIDKDKLVGTWTFVKTDSKDAPPPGATMTVEFTKDGKVTVTFTLKEKSSKSSGTYKVEGNQLTTTMKGRGGKDKTDKVTITTLTDKKLVTTETNDGKTETTEFKK